ncbi:unnamed protein product [Cochlearia groenlandica]
MENSVNVFRKSNTPRSPSRLQRKAPAALHIEPVPDNPLLQQSSDAVAASAIPLLSPLYVSPNQPSSLPVGVGEGEDFTFSVGFTEETRSQPSMDHKELWQYSAKADQSNELALLDMFQTKFMLVDNSQ